MCAMIYRHRPILSALIAAGLSCVAGVLLVFGMRQRYEAGVAPASSVMLAGCVTIVLTGSFLIVAFSRYRFTHLWKTPQAAHSKKHRHHRTRR
ncbi:hypothetical protein [Pontiella sulfatireligans]|uniref:Uncharacterized protein n=1 Tax=Pontiella sulfatireligans TaxID=2750658 RepID=A0A6C2USP8_9BACT|nr:hypothetical protein [Pontiella sulfatireligans]VGO22281.1 hypothetical protein SCARR_04363 [Pontiella sulfatireligans]